MSPGSMLVLLLTILSEVVGTVALKASEGFARLGPDVLVVVGYGLSLYLLVPEQIAPGSSYSTSSGVPPRTKAA